MIHSLEVAHERGGQVDRYVLRGWLWCSVSDRLMVPALVSTGERHYGCPDRECPRPLVPAERVEGLVWGHFAHLNPVSADQVRPEARREALRLVLARVWVGADGHTLSYDWRP